MINKKVVATIEARMGSTRLPGKVLRFINGKPMLEYLIDSLKKIKNIDEIIIATTKSSKDDEIVNFAREVKVFCYRGSEDDVLGRVVNAASKSQADVIIQLTGDNPIIDSDIIKKSINIFFEKQADCVENFFEKRFPSGMEVCVVKYEILKKISELSLSKTYREHVPLFLKINKKQYKIISVLPEKNLARPDLSFTVDTQKDFDNVSLIISNFKKKNKEIDCSSLVKFCDEKN